MRDLDSFVADATEATVARIRANLRARRPFAPIHPRLTAAERAALPIGPVPDGTLAVLFTSGTTGRPRGAILSRAAFIAAARASAARLGWRDDDRWLVPLPLAHVGGLSVIVRCLLARKPVLLGRPDRIAADILDRRATIVSLVPTLLERLLGEGFLPPPWLRLILVGGAAAPPGLMARALARGFPVAATYGLTEACSQVATALPGEPGCGRPLVPLRIGAGGEIEVGGPTLFDGYLGEPPRATGWHPTGDHGFLDDDGCLHVLGRRTDLIVTGGENVYPAEVEAYLDARGIAACVVGAPDATWGAVVTAVVTAPFDPALLADLAPWKRPRRQLVVAALPLTAGGKPDRAAARLMAARAAS